MADRMSSRSNGMDHGYAGCGRPARRSLMLGTALAGAAAVAMLSSRARAADECGTPTGNSVTCTPAGNPYAGGISYVTPVDLTVNLDSGVAIRSGDNIGVLLSGSGAAALTLEGADDSSIATTGYGAFGVLASNNAGDLTIHTGSIKTAGDYADGILAISSSGTIGIDVGSVSTTGGYGAKGITAIAFGGDVSTAADSVTTTGYGSTGLDIQATGGTAAIDVGAIETAGERAYGAQVIGYDGATADVGSLTTHGDGSTGLFMAAIGDGDVNATVGSVTTTGGAAGGINAQAYYGNVAVNVGNVSTEGRGSYGVAAESFGGNASIASTGTISTSGDYARGAEALAVGASGDASVDVATIDTSGYGSRGAFAYSAYGDATVTSTGSITTTGENASGAIAVSAHALGDATVSVNDVSVSGDHIRGLYGTTYAYPFASGVYAFGDNATITVSGDLTSTGEFTRGAYARALDHAEVDVAGTTTTTADYANAITAVGYLGGVTVHAGDVVTYGHSSIGIDKFNGAGPDDSADVTAGDVTTHGSASIGVAVYATQNVSVDVGDVLTEGDGSTGIVVRNTGYSYGGYDTVMSVTANSVTTTDAFASGVVADSSDSGTVSIDVGKIATQGYYSSGVHANATYADIGVDVGSVSTGGDYGDGVYAVSLLGGVTVSSSDAIATTGFQSRGVYAVSAYGAGDADVTVNDVTTRGDNSPGVVAAGANANVTVNGNVSTAGYNSPGVYAVGLAGNATVTNNGSVTTSGDYSAGIYAAAAGNVTVDGNGEIATSGDYSTGIVAQASGNGNVTIAAGSVSTEGDYSTGIVTRAVDGDTAITVGDVTTAGDYSSGIDAVTTGAGDISITSTGTISTQATTDHSILNDGTFATPTYGISAQTNGDVDVAVNNVTTTGNYATGIFARGAYADVAIDGTVSTAGYYADAVHVVGVYGATVTNNGTVTPGLTGEPDTDTAKGNNTSADRVGMTTSAALTIGKSHPAGTSAVAGSPFTWTITVDNAGPSTSFASSDAPIELTDTLPVGVQFRESTSGGFTCTPGTGADEGIVTCERTTPLPLGATTINLTGLVLSGALGDEPTPGVHQLTNTVTLSRTTTTDPSGANSATDTVPLTFSADLVLVKSHDDIPVVPGETATWTLAPANLGPSVSRATIADPIVVTDTLPASVDTVTATGSGWDCSVSVPTVTCIFGTAAAPTDAAVGALPVITVTARVRSDQRTAVVNTATIAAGATPDPLASNNTDTDTGVTLTPQADLRITKTHSGSATAGSPFGWTLTARDLGPSSSWATADDPITIVDQLPAGNDFHQC